MAKCLLRIDKYTSDQVAKVDNHNNRKFQDKASAPNIDPTRTALNEKFIGSKNMRQDLIKALENRTNKRALRKDANLMLEVIFSASAEYFFNDLDKAAFDKWTVEKNKIAIANLYNNNLNKDALEKYKSVILDFCKTDEFFKDRVFSIDLHMDEKTPHFQVCLVPRTDDGRISCKDFWTPVRTLELQNRYAQACAKLGLERGEEDSQSIHVSHHDHNATLNIPQPPQIKIPKVDKPGIFTKASTVHEDYQEREKAQGKKYSFYKNYYNENCQNVASLKVITEQNKQLKQNNKQLSIKNKKHDSEKLEKIRTISCEEVLANLNYKQIDTGFFQKDKHSVKVNKDKNSCLDNYKKKGVGAISFLMNCLNYKFLEAVDFLQENFSTEDVARVASTHNHAEELIKENLLKRKKTFELNKISKIEILAEIKKPLLVRESEDLKPEAQRSFARRL